jgi:O-methyltransferase involved in polyketide biosynthesis
LEKEKVILPKKYTTLMIPLYCRASESRKKNPIIYDARAMEMVDTIDYDFQKLQIPMQTYLTLCLRAKQFDEYVKKYMEMMPGSMVFHLGCGLDSRFERVDNSSVTWYDLDFPEVIELRRKFFQETARYHFVPSSVMELSWLDGIKSKNKPAIILAEGLLMYLKAAEIKKLLLVFRDKFPGSVLIFDAFSEAAAKGVNNHPSLTRTGAKVTWGLNHPREIEKWHQGFRLLEEWYFSQPSANLNLSLFYRLIFRFAHLFPAARNAHRLFVFQLG